MKKSIEKAKLDEVLAHIKWCKENYTYGLDDETILDRYNQRATLIMSCVPQSGMDYYWIDLLLTGTFGTMSGMGLSEDVTNEDIYKIFEILGWEVA